MSLFQRAHDIVSRVRRDHGWNRKRRPLPRVGSLALGDRHEGGELGEVRILALDVERVRPRAPRIAADLALHEGAVALLRG